VLHRGKVRIAHFQHKQKGICTHGVGETEAHRQLKITFQKSWMGRENVEAVIEKSVVGSDGSKRFIDVYIAKASREFAIEVVHTNDDLREVTDKNSWLMKRGIAPIWVSVVRERWVDEFEAKSQGLTIEQYTPTQFEKWAHALGLGEFYIALPRGVVICGKMEKTLLYKSDSSYFDADAREEVYVAGGAYRSKLYRDIKILWKRGIGDLSISRRKRDSFERGAYSFPSGWIGQLLPR
jgi:competence protein CoiA